MALGHPVLGTSSFCARHKFTDFLEEQKRGTFIKWSLMHVNVFELIVAASILLKNVKKHD